MEATEELPKAFWLLLAFSLSSTLMLYLPPRSQASPQAAAAAHLQVCSSLSNLTNEQ